MIKISHIRDYCISAFVFFANNFGSFSCYKEHLIKSAESEHDSLKINIDTDVYCNHFLEKYSSCLYDVKCVEDTILYFESVNNFDVVKAVKLVYFPLKYNFTGNSIYNNCVKASLELCVSVRTVYRYLDKANKVFAEKRGLRI